METLPLKLVVHPVALPSSRSPRGCREACHLSTVTSPPPFFLSKLLCGFTEGSISHPQEMFRLPCAAHHALMYATSAGRGVVGGGPVQGPGGWAAARPPGEAYPEEERAVSQARPGAGSWPVGLARGEACEEIKEPLCLLSSRRHFSFHCSAGHGAAPRQAGGGRAAAGLCQASAPAVTASPGRGCRTTLMTPAGCWWPSPVSGGKTG